MVFRFCSGPILFRSRRDILRDGGSILPPCAYEALKALAEVFRKKTPRTGEYLAPEFRTF